MHFTHEDNINCAVSFNNYVLQLSSLRTIAIIIINVYTPYVQTFYVHMHTNNRSCLATLIY